MVFIFDPSYKIIDIVWSIAMVFILLKVFLMAFSQILSFVSMIFIEKMYVVALASIIMTISPSTFHPLLVMLSISN